jgi:amyloid beta A4 protein
MELIPGIEPVMNVELQLEDMHQSHAQQARFVHEHTGFDSEQLSEFAESSSSRSSVFALVGAAVFIVALVATIIAYRRRSRQRQGFIEVDLYTPEEKHVATMQHNGYENPTYTYFEKA